MGTGALVGHVFRDGSFECNKVEYGGYPQNIVPILKNSYYDDDTISDLIEDNIIRKLGDSPNTTEYYSNCLDVDLRMGNKFSVRELRHIALTLYCSYIYYWVESEQKWHGECVGRCSYDDIRVLKELDD